MTTLWTLYYLVCVISANTAQRSLIFWMFKIAPVGAWTTPRIACTTKCLHGILRNPPWTAQAFPQVQPGFLATSLCCATKALSLTTLPTVYL